jgi:hypothetical protein
MKHLVLIISFAIFSISISFAQFPGGVGTSGTTAIHKDSSIFIAWATQCTVIRGYADIANPTLGTVSFGQDTLALGKADSKVVSLGDRGSAIVSFALPIKDGAGFDFAVFENAFNDTFLELAVVEVSSDGIHYFRFPAYSNTQTSTQIGPFDNTGDPTKIHNLAGKYRVLYGTPFDLAEIPDNPLLDKNNVRYIRVIDVVGSINPTYATYDIQNNPINDPYPTAFATGGFDLDAVGVIHANTNSIGDFLFQKNLSVYPNPCVNEIFITSVTSELYLQIIDNEGKIYVESIIQPTFEPYHCDVSFLSSKMYFVVLQDKQKRFTKTLKIFKT